MTWPLSRSKAGGDLVLIQTPLSFSCKCGLVSITTIWFTWEKQWGLYQDKVTSSLASTQRPGHSKHNCKMGYFHFSVEPPGPADKILHRLHYLQVKTRQTCHARSRNPLTERLKTQLHSMNCHDPPEYFRLPTSCEIASHLCFLSKDCLYPSTQLYDARQGASEVENSSKNTLINQICTEL